MNSTIFTKSIINKQECVSFKEVKERNSLELFKEGKEMNNLVLTQGKQRSEAVKE